jgi:hypothetical protein
LDIDLELDIGLELDNELEEAFLVEFDTFHKDILRALPFVDTLDNQLEDMDNQEDNLDNRELAQAQEDNYFEC